MQDAISQLDAELMDITKVMKISPYFSVSKFITFGELGMKCFAKDVPMLTRKSNGQFGIVSERYARLSFSVL